MFALDGTTIHLAAHKSCLFLQQAKLGLRWVDHCLVCLTSAKALGRLEAVRHTPKCALKCRETSRFHLGLGAPVEASPKVPLQAARRSAETSSSGPAQTQPTIPGRQQLICRALPCMRKPGDEQPGHGRAGVRPYVQLAIRPSVSHAAQKCVNRCHSWP